MLFLLLVLLDFLVKAFLLVEEPSFLRQELFFLFLCFLLELELHLKDGVFRTDGSLFF